MLGFLGSTLAVLEGLRLCSVLLRRPNEWVERLLAFEPWVVALTAMAASMAQVKGLGAWGFEALGV